MWVCVLIFIYLCCGFKQDGDWVFILWVRLRVVFLYHVELFVSSDPELLSSIYIHLFPTIKMLSITYQKCHSHKPWPTFPYLLNTCLLNTYLKHWIHPLKPTFLSIKPLNTNLKPSFCVLWKILGWLFPWSLLKTH